MACCFNSFTRGNENLRISTKPHKFTISQIFLINYLVGCSLPPNPWSFNNVWYNHVRLPCLHQSGSSLQQIWCLFALILVRAMLGLYAAWGDLRGIYARHSKKSFYLLKLCARSSAQGSQQLWTGCLKLGGDTVFGWTDTGRNIKPFCLFSNSMWFQEVVVKSKMSPVHIISYPKRMWAIFLLLNIPGTLSSLGWDKSFLNVDMHFYLNSKIRTSKERIKIRL